MKQLGNGNGKPGGLYKLLANVLETITTTFLIGIEEAVKKPDLTKFVTYAVFLFFIAYLTVREQALADRFSYLLVILAIIAILNKIMELAKKVKEGVSGLVTKIAYSEFLLYALPRCHDCREGTVKYCPRHKGFYFGFFIMLWLVLLFTLSITGVICANLHPHYPVSIIILILLSFGLPMHGLWTKSGNPAPDSFRFGSAMLWAVIISITGFYAYLLAKGLC